MAFLRDLHEQMPDYRAAAGGLVRRAGQFSVRVVDGSQSYRSIQHLRQRHTGSYSAHRYTAAHNTETCTTRFYTVHGVLCYRTRYAIVDLDQLHLFWGYLSHSTACDHRIRICIRREDEEPARTLGVLTMMWLGMQYAEITSV